MFPTPRSCGEAARAKVETVKNLEGVEVF